MNRGAQVSVLSLVSLLTLGSCKLPGLEKHSEAASQKPAPETVATSVDTTYTVLPDGLVHRDTRLEFDSSFGNKLNEFRRHHPGNYTYIPIFSDLPTAGGVLVKDTVEVEGGGVNVIHFMDSRR